MSLNQAHGWRIHAPWVDTYLRAHDSAPLAHRRATGRVQAPLARDAALYRRYVTEPLNSADFERFVVRHFGTRGRAWLDQLPARVERYARFWQFGIEHHLAAA